MADLQELLAEVVGSELAPSTGDAQADWWFEQANVQANLYDQAAESAVYAARDCGRLLIQIKGRCPRGQWLNWIETQFSHSPRQAQKYMRLAHHWEELAERLGPNTSPGTYLGATPTINGVLALLAEAKGADLPPGLQGGQDEDDVVEVVGELVEEAEPAPVAGVALRNADAHDVHLTPPPVKELVYAFWPDGVDLDPCSNSLDRPNIEARNLYVEADDGLSRQWHRKVFLNPPYSGQNTTLKQWIDKLLWEFAHRRVTEALVFVPNYSSEKWWAALDEHPYCTIRGRVTFAAADGSPQPSAARFPSVMFYLGDRVQEFGEVFGALGRVWVPLERCIALRQL